MRTDTELLDYVIKYWESWEFVEIFGWQALTPEEFRYKLNLLMDEDEK